MSYNSSSEEMNSQNSILSRKFYLDSSSILNNTNITITNSTGGIVYSNLTNGSIPTQTLLSYINNGGTRTWYSNYTLTASVSGYITNTTIINLTDNTNVIFNLVANPVIPVVEETPSSSSTPSYSPTANNLQTGYSQQLGKSWNVAFNIGEEKHGLKVGDINNQNKTALIIVSSSPQEKWMSIGDEWKINLNKDNYYDLYVKLENIKNNLANVTIRTINEQINVEGNGSMTKGDTNEVVQNKENYALKYFIIFGLVIILLGIVFLIVKIRDKKRHKNLMIRRRR